MRQNAASCGNELLFSDITNIAEILEFVFGRSGNIVEKGGNASYHHFLLLPQSFQKISFKEWIKRELCGKHLQTVINLTEKVFLTEMVMFT